MRLGPKNGEQVVVFCQDFHSWNVSELKRFDKSWNLVFDCGKNNIFFYLSANFTYILEFLP